MPPPGAGPKALGLAGGLAIRSLFFAPSNLPVQTVNVSTLRFPMFRRTFRRGNPLAPLRREPRSGRLDVDRFLTGGPVPGRQAVEA